MIHPEDRMYKLNVLQSRPMMDAARLAVMTRYMPATSAMFSFDQTPYLETPTASLSDIAGVCGVVVKSPAQIGKSTMIENFLSWIVEYDRANTMVILDTQKSAEKMSRGRIRPFLRTRGINNPKNSATKDPDKSNSVVNIGLGSGANLFLCSAKSPSDLRSTPSKYCAFDEVDAWPIELIGEGDPLQNAIQRMMRFRGMYLITSTPTLYEGRINQNFLIGTQETWGCECECGAFMDVRFDDIDFNGDTPVYCCKKCGQVYNEQDVIALHHRYSEPKNSKPFIDKYGRRLRSFEIFGTLCHHFYTWDYLKRLEEQSQALGEASYQSFRNTRLAEVYKHKDSIDIAPEELMKQSNDDYSPDCLPVDVAFIVCGLDTHDKCLFCETAGFSADLKHIYGLDYSILEGDPSEPDVWKKFEEVFNRTYKKHDGTEIKPRFAFCDSGGHRTNAVYMYSFRNRRFMPIKGFVTNNPDTPDPLIGRQQRLKLNAGIKGKCIVQMIGVNAGKDELANLAVLTVAGDKRLHYIDGCGYGYEYFCGLLSEKKIGGKWIAPYGSKTDNEPLDCRIYAMAAANYYLNRYYLTGLDYEGGNMAKKKKQNQNQPTTESIKADPVIDAQPQESPQIADAQPQRQPQPVKKFKHL